jgi:hypothetical protein
LPPQQGRNAGDTKNITGFLRNHSYYPNLAFEISLQLLSLRIVSRDFQRTKQLLADSKLYLAQTIETAAAEIAGHALDPICFRAITKN